MLLTLLGSLNLVAGVHLAGAGTTQASGSATFTPGLLAGVALAGAGTTQETGSAALTTRVALAGVGTTSTTSSATFTPGLAGVALAGGGTTRATGTALIAWTDPYTSDVSLLLHFDGSLADSSYNNVVLSTFGTAAVESTTTAFGSGALALDGSTAYVTTPPAALFGFGANDYTVEGWAYPAAGTFGAVFENRGSGVEGIGVYVGTAGSGFAGLVVANDTAVLLTAGSFPSSTWSHWAVCNHAGTLYLFTNGTLVGSVADGRTLASSAKAYIGANYILGQLFTGNLDEIRVTNGIARYTASFSPPTAPFLNYAPPVSVALSGGGVTPSSGAGFFTLPGVLAGAGTTQVVGGAPLSAGGVALVGGGVTTTAGSTTLAFTDPYYLDVSFLIHADGAYSDSSVNAQTINNANGVPIVSSPVVFGNGAVAFYGGTTFLYTYSSALNGLSNQDFAFECWAYPSAPTTDLCLFDNRYYTANSGIAIFLGSSGLSYWNDSGIVASGGTTTGGVYQHIAVTRHAGTVRGFINGTQVFSVAETRTFASSSQVFLGSNYTDGNYWNGYLDEIRLTIGAARYTSSFSVPTVAFVSYGTTPGAALAGAGATPSIGSGTFSPAVALAGAGTTGETGTAALTTRVALAGSGVTNETGSATLSIPSAFAGVGTTQDVGSGALAVAVALTATGRTPATGSGTFSSVVALAGVGTTAETGAATLTVAAALAGGGTTQEVGSGALSIPSAFTGAGTTQATGSAALTTQVALAGAGTTQETGFGALTTQVALTGAGTTPATGAAALTTRAALAGAGTTQEVGSATLSIPSALAGGGVTTSVGSGSLPVGVALAGTGTTQATGTGKFGAALALAGSGTTTEVGSATLTTAAAFAGGGNTRDVGSATLAIGGVALAGSGTTTEVSSATLTTRAALSGGGFTIETGAGALTISTGGVVFVAHGSTGTAGSGTLHTLSAGAVLAGGGTTRAVSVTTLGTQILHAIAAQQIPVPTPVATITGTEKASAAQQMPALAQFYSIGPLHYVAIQTMDDFADFYTVSGGLGPYTHWLACYQMLQDAVTVATMATTEHAAAAQFVSPFTPVAAVAHSLMHVAGSQAFVIAQTATAKLIHALVSAELMPAFTQIATVSSTRHVAGAQTVAPFKQVAVIPGYANFIANLRTFKPNAEARAQTLDAENRDQLFDAENRSNEGIDAENRDNLIDAENRMNEVV